MRYSFINKISLQLSQGYYILTSESLKGAHFIDLVKHTLAETKGYRKGQHALVLNAKLFYTGDDIVSIGVNAKPPLGKTCLGLKYGVEIEIYCCHGAFLLVVCQRCNETIFCDD